MSGIHKTKQEFLGLDVAEVSLVDNPAIEEEWLVIKRLEGKPNVEAALPPQSEADIQKAVWTGAFINDLPDSAFLYIEPGGKKDADGKTVPRSLRHFPYKGADGKIDLPHLRNAISRIPQAKIPGLDRAALAKLQDKARKLLEKEQETKKMADTDVKKSDEDTKPAEPEAKPTTEPEASTAEADVKKATELFEQANALLAPHKPAEAEAKPEPEEKPVVKALIGMLDGQLVIDQDMLEVAKAKTFSKGRTAALETATKAMITLLKEVAPETVQKLMGGEVQTQKSVEPDPEDKPKTEQLAEAITAAVTKALEPLDTRLKDLEGAKATPKSGDGDQSAEVKKSAGDSVWAGSALHQ